MNLGVTSWSERRPLPSHPLWTDNSRGRGQEEHLTAVNQAVPSSRPRFNEVPPALFAPLGASASDHFVVVEKRGSNADTTAAAAAARHCPLNLPALTPHPSPPPLPPSVPVRIKSAPLFMGYLPDQDLLQRGSLTKDGWRVGEEQVGWGGSEGLRGSPHPLSPPTPPAPPSPPGPTRRSRVCADD